jgi:hypothetical protein
LGCIPGDLGDARFNDAILEHVYLWMTGREASLLSPSFFYPMPGVLAFSDNHFGTAWVYALFRLAGWDRYEAFDLWYLTGYLINFVVCHLVFRKLRFSPVASAVGAFAFAFPMPVVAQFAHAQLTYRFLIPVGLLLWQRFRESGSWRWLGGLAIAVVGQFYISIYLGYFLALLIIAWAGAQWWIEGFGPRQWLRQWSAWRQPADRTELAMAVVLMLLAFAALAWLMWPYMHFSKIYGFQRSPEEVASMLPRIQSYLVADTSAMWRNLSSLIPPTLPMRPEHQLFTGLGIIGLVLVGVTRSSLRLRWVALLSVALLFLLTLSVGGHSIYLAVTRLPGLGAIRAVTRIVSVMAFPLALLVAVAVDAQRSAPRRWQLFVAALVVLMVCESASTRPWTFDIAEARTRIQHVRGLLPEPLPAKAMVFNPIRDGEVFYLNELDGVILAQDVGHPTLNGYSGNIPTGYSPQGGSSPCAQAQARLQGASSFFEQTLKRSLPDRATAPIVIVGDAQDCSPVGR